MRYHRDFVIIIVGARYLKLVLVLGETKRWSDDYDEYDDDDGDGDDDAGGDGSKIEGSRREGAKRGSVPPNPGG